MYSCPTNVCRYISRKELAVRSRVLIDDLQQSRKLKRSYLVCVDCVVIEEDLEIRRVLKNFSRGGKEGSLSTLPEYQPLEKTQPTRVPREIFVCSSPAGTERQTHLSGSLAAIEEQEKE